jgi:hypothetical protein
VDIEALKTEARKLARVIALKDRDVEDTVAAMRLRLRSKVVKLFQDTKSPDRLAAKGQDDASAQVHALIEEVYVDAARHAFENEEEITPAVVLRELATAIDHIKRVKGVVLAESSLIKRARAYYDKQDIITLLDFLELMSILRGQIVSLRSNYAVTHVSSGRFLYWHPGWADFLEMLDYHDFCVEFLEKERERLKLPLAS